MSRLLLIDAMGTFYRSFFGMRPMLSPKGEPVHALFGFIRKVEQLRRQLNPSHLAVVMEGGLPVYRVELVPDYKGQRDPMPDDLRSQLPLLDRYLEAFSGGTIRCEGWEADDAMASAAAQFSTAVDDVAILTSDKDLFQMVGGNTRLVNVKGEATLLAEDYIVAKTGVLPSQIVDWLALIGDSADNIPGVRGVGPKTATKLLAQFGSLEAMWTDLAAVESDKLREKLSTARELVDRNVKMVRLKLDLTDLPPLTALGTARGDVPALLALYDDCGFATLAKDLREPSLFD